MKVLRPVAVALILLNVYQPVIATTHSSKSEPLNIILIMADDLGYETIGANGGESYKTPHLDRLAEQGARFEHCYAQPLCTPSRVKIMTGKYNFRNYTKFGQLKRGETTFAHLLKKSGYATCIAGKWQLGREADAPQHFGFDQALLWQHTRKRTREGSSHDTRFENPRLELNGANVDYNDGEYGPDAVVEFICDFIEKKKDGPFLVYYPMMLTHCPFVPTPDSKDWNPGSLGSESYKGDAAYFEDMVTYMDKLVGQITNKVAELGLSEKTIILFTGDNGTDRPVVSMLNGSEVAGRKGKTTDAGTRVPLIAYGPENVRPSVINDLVDFSDFLPTLCDIAGIETPSDVDGQSFLPQLRGQEGTPREFVYCWYSSKGSEKDARVFARNQDYKLYRNGAFFNVPKDPLEQQPLNSDSLEREEAKIRSMLQAAIDQYETIRDK